MNKSHNLPWTEKYRPSQLEDIESNNKILFTLKTLIENDKFPHLLFYGPPGTGKTSAILACANLLYKNFIDTYVIHLNASDERGIDVVRERIRDFCSANVLFQENKPKLVILDEADSMTLDAQLALRQIVANNTKKVRFCLICNYVNKIIPQLQSRFSKFRFKPIEHKYIINKLKFIINQENIKCDDYSLNILAEMCHGDMRKLVNILQSICVRKSIINKDNIFKLLNYIKDEDISKIIDSLFNSSFEENLYFLKEYLNTGVSLQELLKRLSNKIFLLDLSNDSLIFLINKLSELESNPSINDNIKLGTFISIFIIIRNKNFY